MKKLLSIFWVLALCFSVTAQTTDFLSKKEFQGEKKKIWESSREQKKMILLQKKTQDSITTILNSEKKQWESVYDSLSVIKMKLSNIQGNLDSNQQKANLKRVIIVLGFVLLIVLLLLIFFWTKTRMRILNDDLLESNKKLTQNLETELKTVKDSLIKQEELTVVKVESLKARIVELYTVFQDKQLEMEKNNQAGFLKTTSQIQELNQTTSETTMTLHELSKTTSDQMHKLDQQIETKFVEIKKKITELEGRKSSH